MLVWLSVCLSLSLFAILLHLPKLDGVALLVTHPPMFPTFPFSGCISLAGPTSCLPDLLWLLEVSLESIAEAPAGLQQLPPGQVQLCPLLLGQLRGEAPSSVQQQLHLTRNVPATPHCQSAGPADWQSTFKVWQSHNLQWLTDIIATNSSSVWPTNSWTIQEV